MSFLNKLDVERLRLLVLSPDCPGYKPNVIESPNGDARLDTGKRCAHVALKHLDTKIESHLWMFLLLHMANHRAKRVAKKAGVHPRFLPDVRYSAMRVLEYPPGEGGHEHTDFDLLTLMLYRDQSDKFVGDWHDIPAAVSEIDPQCHLGEIAEIIGAGKATKHSVLPSDTMQISVVFFAIPDHDAVLPTGVTVGDWIAERMSRSGYDK